jgi:hypothetical protein
VPYRNPIRCTSTAAMTPVSASCDGGGDSIAVRSGTYPYLHVGALPQLHELLQVCELPHVHALHVPASHSTAALRLHTFHTNQDVEHTRSEA